MKLLGLSIVLSLAVGCALPTNDKAHESSAAQNAATPNDPNGNATHDQGGQELSPPDDDPGNEEGGGDQTCHSTAVVPDGWTVYDGGEYTVAAPADAWKSASPPNVDFTASGVSMMVNVREGMTSVDAAEAFQKAFFAAGKDGPRPCQIRYDRVTLDCHDALTIKGACYYDAVEQIDWVNVVADGKTYFLYCDSTMADDATCAKFFASFHVKK